MKGKRMRLALIALVKFGLGFLLMGLMLFWSAGTIRYYYGWVFLAAFGVPMIVFGLYLLIKEPDTLERRLHSKETETEQKQNILLGGLQFIAVFILAGLDHRFSWSNMSVVVVRISLLIMLIGYAMFVAVILKNTYASRVVQVSEGQSLITDGPYSVVRHPMYTATLLLFLSMPFVLGSYFALLPMLFYPFILVRRIKNEEQVLIGQLEGYKEYMEKTQYRLIPYIW